MENQSIKNNDKLENLLHDTFDSKKEYSDIDSWKHIKQKMFKQYFFRFNPARFNIFYAAAATAVLSAGIYTFSPEQKAETKVQTTSSAEKAMPIKTEENAMYQASQASQNRLSDSTEQASIVSIPVEKDETHCQTANKTNKTQTASIKQERESKGTKTAIAPVNRPAAAPLEDSVSQKDSLISNNQLITQDSLQKNQDSSANHKKVKKVVYIQKQPVVIQDTLRQQKKRRRASKRKPQ